MGQYVGLDVSLKETSICVMDGEGTVLHRATVPTDAKAVEQNLVEHSFTPDRIVHESGLLSIWLQRGFLRLGLPAVCIDARLAHKALSAKLNKSDRADAEGLAHLARTGWYTEVHIRSEAADRLRTLITARERLVRLRKDLEAHIRGVLKTFGIRMSDIGQGRLRARFREQLAVAGEADPSLAMIADGFCAVHETLCVATDGLTDDLKRIAKESSLTQRLMTVPGVGPIVALNFAALIDDANRFKKTSDVGAFLGSQLDFAHSRCMADGLCDTDEAFGRYFLLV
jgi:transposase